MEPPRPTLAEIAGDSCPECEGKGYTVSQYTWEYGTEWEPHECEECEGSGFVMPVVETEELIEQAG